MAFKNIDYRYDIHTQPTGFWAFALHDGHDLDDHIQYEVALDSKSRLREEDPYTGELAALPMNRFIVSTSRFQLDLNRVRDNAVYLIPDQAWGLQVFKDTLEKPIIEQLYQIHDRVYAEIDRLIQYTIATHGYAIIYDIHSYNAKRTGPSEEIDVEVNPEINLGTKYNHPKWRELIQHFIRAVDQGHDTNQSIDIRENIKFCGGYLNQYITKHYGEKACVLSIEFRKDFMDEWTGQLYPDKLQQYHDLMEKTIDPLKNYLTYYAR